VGLNNIETTLQAIDLENPNDDIITLDEINKYLKEGHSEVEKDIAKKAFNLLNNLKNRISPELENLKQRIVFDSLKLKPWIEQFREIIWDSANNAKVNPSVLALLMNWETEWWKTGLGVTNKSGFMWLSQMWDRALNTISWMPGVSVQKYKNTLKWSIDTLENRAKIQIYYWALFLNKKQSNRVKKVEWFNDFDALVEYNIWWIQYLDRIDNNIGADWSVLRKLHDNQAYGKKNNTTLAQSVIAVSNKDGFNDLNTSYVPKSLQPKFADNINSSVVQERIVAIANAKKYYLDENENNKYLQEVLSYVPTGNIKVPENVQKDFNKTEATVRKELWIDERQQNAWWWWKTSVLDVVWYWYWWLNLFWAIMDWFSWNWWDMIKKLTIAYIWIKNLTGRIKWNLDDWSDKIDNISERYEKKWADKDHLKWVLEKIYNWEDGRYKESIIKNLLPDSKKDKTKFLEKIWWIFKNKIKFKNLENLKWDISKDNLWKWGSEIISKEDFDNLNSDMQWRVIDLLKNCQNLWVKNIQEFQAVSEYVTWNYSPDWYNKIMWLIHSW